MRVGFPLIGGVHQVFHTAPVAAELSRAPDVEVEMLAADPRTLQLAQRVMDVYPGGCAGVGLLDRSALGKFATAVSGRRSANKLPLLWRNRRRLASFDALVVAECTSTILRRIGVRRPRLICVPHGAGDRAISFEHRFRLFDRLLVAGEKTAARMIASGVDPRRVTVVGYPKADLVRRMPCSTPCLFDNDRPTVLYNPHFRRSLSSFSTAPAIVEAFRAQDQFNLIVAPHVRALEDASVAERASLASLAIPGKILVDTGSDRLVDMTYTLASDIYLGDVSSQVYEFLLTPRPCVFLNSHGVAWSSDPDYAFWHLGEVVAPTDVFAAVGRSNARHSEFLAAQTSALASTFGRTDGAAFHAACAVSAELAGPPPNTLVRQDAGTDGRPDHVVVFRRDMDRQGCMPPYGWKAISAAVAASSD